MRLRLDLAYDGTNFNGWAKQPNLRTVQGVIEAALCMVLRIRSSQDEKQANKICVSSTEGLSTSPATVHPIHLTVAGRTDAGVHASYQVCHLDIEPDLLNRCLGHMQLNPIEALEHRLTHVLPADISVHRVSLAPDGFDARFSALERTYIYRIADKQSVRDPRLRNFVLSIDDVLDISLMNAAAERMIGLHDFGSFARPNPGGTTIREVKAASWQRVVSSVSSQRSTGSIPFVEHGLVEFTIIADAFAHNMVRSLVQACVQIGRHKRDLDWFAWKIAVPLREGSTGPIAPQGLTLEYVAYPEDDQLASRAQAIRARRTL